MTAHIDSDRNIETDMMPTVSLQELAAAGDQPGWRVLDTARTQQFTGEITFRTEPSISVYFDDGVAYHAVRSGDPSLCDRLVDAGVLEPAQVERGVIRVGNVENLGRLFDRDPSVDRDAVVVVLELATDDVVTAIANEVTGPFDITAYRHHASGVHRWFVSSSRPAVQPAQLTPVGHVAQLDGSVTGDLPDVTSIATDDAVHIEWDQPVSPSPSTPIYTFDDDLLARLIGESTDDGSASRDATPDSPPRTFAEPTVPDAVPDDVVPDTAEPDNAMAPTEMLTAPVADAAPTADALPMPAPVPAPVSAAETVSSEMRSAEHADAPTEPSTSDDDGVGDVNFQIVWPDGSEQHLTDIDISAADDVVAVDAPSVPEPAPAESPLADAVIIESGAIDLDDDVAAPLPAAPEVFVEPTSPSIEDLAVAASADDDSSTETTTDDVDGAGASALSFDMPTLAFSADNVPEDQQPEEVVDAVRRALEAIEAASVTPTQLSVVEVGDMPAFRPTKPLEFDVVDPLAHDAHETSAEQRPDVARSSASALESALPQAAASPASPAPEGFGGFAPPTMNDSAEAVYARNAAAEQRSAGPAASGVASVVFVDEEPDESDDRSSALKRLIGSLRRK